MGQSGLNPLSIKRLGGRNESKKVIELKILKCWDLKASTQARAEEVPLSYSKRAKTRNK